MPQDKFDRQAFLDRIYGSEIQYESIRQELDEEYQPSVVIKKIKPVLDDGKMPEFVSQLRYRLIEIPGVIYQASGIRIFGKRIKSLLFSTDVALIRNSNADAVLSVYPFTPQMAITNALISASSVPVFTGVGGGTTTGERSVQLAFQSEQAGAFGVVVNSPMRTEVIEKIAQIVDVPIVATISSKKDDYIAKLNAGCNILNVSAGAATAELVQQIRTQVGQIVPIIATGGPTPQSIKQTIEAGANAITYTPPSSADIFAEIMAQYRQAKD